MFVGFVNIWIMPLFFLLSGAAGIFGIKRSFREYSASKILRLLVPYIMGVIILIPPQKYLEALSQHHYTGNYLSFLGEYFSGGIFNYPIGFSSAWIGVIAYHLWFLGHLLVISLAMYPLLRYLSEKGGVIIEKIYKWVSFRGGLLLLFIPVAVIRILLKKSFPDYTSWADLAIFSMYFLLGFIVTKKNGFNNYFIRDRWVALFIGFVLTEFIFCPLE